MIKGDSFLIKSSEVSDQDLEIIRKDIAPRLSQMNEQKIRANGAGPMPWSSLSWWQRRRISSVRTQHKPSSPFTNPRSQLSRRLIRRFFKILDEALCKKNKDA